MSVTRELISLQFGHYSNYIGAHFWNIQDLSFDYTGEKTCDINHDILYREGLSADGRVTYTPRLLLADLKGSLKALPQTGLGESSSNDAIQWHNVETVEEPKVDKNEYLQYIDNNEGIAALSDDYDFNANVSTWTDYLYTRFHQRTINLVNQYKHNDSKVPFETFNAGEAVWCNPQYSEIFMDNIRQYAEECDSIQGFHVTLDATDGFGGLATQCLYSLNDEYHNKSIYALPVIASHFMDNKTNSQIEIEQSHVKDSTRLLNVLLTLNNLFECSSMFTLLCCGENGWRKPGPQRKFYNVNYNNESYYESSALLATAIETISLKYRQKNSEFNLSDICVDMTGYGRKMAAFSLGLPFDMKENDCLIDRLDKANDLLWTSITPNCNIASDKVFQHIMVRGIPETKLKRPIETAKNQLSMAAYRCDTVKEMFQFYFQCNSFASATNVSVMSKGMEIKTPFPKVFDKDLNRCGFVKEFENSEIVESVPVISGLHNGNFLFDMLETLKNDAKRIKVAKLRAFASVGVGRDEIVNVLDQIAEYQSNYEDSFEL